MLALVFGALAGTYASRASAGFARNLRHDMYYKVQDFSFSNIDKFSTGSIVTRLTTDVTNVQNSFQMITRIAVRCPVMLVFSLAMAFRINGQVAWAFLGVLPVLAIGLGILMKIVSPVFARVFKTYDRMNTVVQENLSGLRVVKAYVREEHEMAKFKGVSGLFYKEFSKVQKTMVCARPLMQLCLYACILLISWFGARLIVGDSMTTGELTSRFSYVMQILMSLMMVAMVFVMITMSRTSAQRISELLTEESNCTIRESRPMRSRTTMCRSNASASAIKSLHCAMSIWISSWADDRHTGRHRLGEIITCAAHPAYTT